eukprot:TRINITY_DN15345_c0_g1_i2.p1 TRINITY_DN15345_c0_g1~~TRINITY_DN15345_c0_g1_i2.p1  ORF type:complete len:180 (+),score=47.84 TRINITY_DN15345_c0_g1_i2:14-553(+)
MDLFGFGDVTSWAAKQHKPHQSKQPENRSTPAAATRTAMTAASPATPAESSAEQEQPFHPKVGLMHDAVVLGQAEFNIDFESLPVLHDLSCGGSSDNVEEARISDFIHLEKKANDLHALRSLAGVKMLSSESISHLLGLLREFENYLEFISKSRNVLAEERSRCLEGEIKVLVDENLRK